MLEARIGGAVQGIERGFNREGLVLWKKHVFGKGVLICLCDALQQSGTQGQKRLPLKQIAGFLSDVLGDWVLGLFRFWGICRVMRLSKRKINPSLLQRSGHGLSYVIP